MGLIVQLPEWPWYAFVGVFIVGAFLWGVGSEAGGMFYDWVHDHVFGRGEEEPKHDSPA
jgi:hypothetical protein